MSRENFISRRARGLETVVKVVDVPSLFSTTARKAKQRVEVDEEVVTLVIRCTNVKLIFFFTNIFI